MEEVQVPGKDGKTLAIVRQAQVRWTETPQIIHPLTGDALDLHWLEVSIQAAKKRAFDHFSALLVKLGAGQGAPIDWRRVLLTFWRFGPELDATGADTRDNERLGALWELLPADTRVPDHSIWEHLDLASAFAGAFCADARGEAALLAIALGPVQGFIAQARKLDDLWAGSHLLARLAWETMKPVAETLGPDAILFPKLRGLAQVDVWLREEMKLPSELFERCEWTRGESDANPLFAAALPNRFVAIVPADRAQALAERCAAAARAWINELGQTVVRRLLEVAGLDDRPDCPAYAQMRAQLAGFPEIYWATVPFSLVRCRDEERQRDLDVSALLRAMAPFFGTEPDELCGFLDSPAWKALGSDLEVRQGGRTTRFCAPNPGVLYPAVYDLVERLLAAAKSTRTFDRLEQGGWRESLAGEVEWLTHDRAQLALPPGERRKADTLWTRIAKRERRPAWAREGEHLGALAALKRLWPTLFAEEVSRVLGRPIDRYPVSTHTMALAAQLDVWLEKGGLTSGLDEAEKLLEQLEGEARPVALPRRLVIRHRAQEKSLKDARRIPALLDEASDADETNPSNAEAVRKIRTAVKCTLATAVDEDQRKSFRVETYYGLLMLDGDRMGAILSGDPQTAISYRGSLHPEVRKGFDELAAGNSGLTEYGEASARSLACAAHGDFRGPQ
ncbi:MAG: type III-B CRISPR-associated protein Cas10/Cmr2 [Burkholderiales bacterium]|nr:type III-B CRISPR-associated protein Cas10/Cmr2 [Burkholderiales bacterium]